MKQKPDILRITRKHDIELEASASVVFPLLCPVREADWIYGWEHVCTLIYTESGIAEEACVSETHIPSEGRAVWICTKYDPVKMEIEYVKHIVGRAIVKWLMAVENLPGGRSAIHADYNITSLSKKGNSYVQMMADKGIAGLFEGLQKKINYFLASGEPLKTL